jgi:uncharacterized delta-60 repeat protein
MEARMLLDAGEIDANFGTDGTVFLDAAGGLDFVNSVAVHSDGMIIVAGRAEYSEAFQSRKDLAVARFDSDGSLDADFGDEGVALFDFDDNANGDFDAGSANDVAVQTDGKIVVAGEIPPLGGFLLLRLSSDSSLDADFNGSGLFTTDLSARANAVVIQPDKKIVVVGDAEGPLGFQIFLARFNEDGSLDTGFDEDGFQFTSILVADGSATAVALQTDGKIVVAGYGTSEVSNLSAFVIARYNGDDGSLDSSFGDEGLVRTTVATDSKASDVAIDEDGRIIVVGSDDGSFVLARYNEDGSLDSTFNEDGVVTIDDLNPVIGGTTGGGVVIQPDGKIVVTASGGNDFVVLRFNTDGSLDTTFNGVGKVVTDLAVTFDSSEALALQEDGNIVVAGISGGDWAAVRYFGDAEATPSPWQNPADRFDVNDDQVVVPLDVLRIVNELNEPTVANSQGKLPATRPEGALYFDVDGNGFITPLDALGIINFLNSSGGSEGEGDLDLNGWSIPVDTVLAQIAVDVADERLRRRISRHKHRV